MKRIMISVISVISILLFSLSSYALDIRLSIGNNGNTAWRCEASSIRGSAWYAIAYNRSEASATALRICERQTYGWDRCYSTGCNQVSQQQYSGRWQCNVMSIDGQVWFGVGKSSRTARSNAINYCRANSFYPRSCDTISCFKR